jgi:hypothetical protein
MNAQAVEEKFATIPASALIFLIVLAVYSPIIFSDYMVHDDYWIATFDPSPPDCQDEIWRSVASIGRLWSAYATRCVMAPFLQYYGAEDSIRIFRLFSFGCSTIFILCLNYVMKDLALSRLNRIAICVLVATVPAFSLIATNGIQASISPSFILVALSILCIHRFSQDETSLKRLVVRHAVVVGAASILIINSLMFYQTAAPLLFCYALLIALHSLSSGDLATRVGHVTRSYVAIASFTVAAGAYFLIQKYVIVPWIMALGGVGESRKFEIELPLLVQQFKHVIGFYVPRLAHIWWISGGYRNYSLFGFLLFGLESSIILIALLLASSGRLRTKEQPSVLFLAVGAIVISAVGVNLILFIRPGEAGLFRTLLGPHVALVLCFGWVATVIAKALRPEVPFWVRYIRPLGGTGVLVVLAFVVMRTQYVIVNYNFETAVKELAYLQGAIQPFISGNENQIILVRPTGNPHVPGGEFSVMSTHSDYGINGLLERIYRSQDSDISEVQVENQSDRQVKIFNADTALDPTEPPFKVRMQNLVSPATYGTILASSTLEPYGTDRLLDPTNPTGWHAATPVAYPQWLFITFDEILLVHKVIIYSQRPNFPKRGPKRVVLEGMEFGGSWIHVGETDDACTLHGGEGTEIPLETPRKLSALRILIESNCGDPNLLTVQYVKFQ